MICKKKNLFHYLRSSVNKFRGKENNNLVPTRSIAAQG